MATELKSLKLQQAESILKKLDKVILIKCSFLSALNSSAQQRSIPFAKAKRDGQDLLDDLYIAITRYKSIVDKYCKSYKTDLDSHIRRYNTYIVIFS